MKPTTLSIRAKLFGIVLIVGTVTGAIVVAALVQMNRANRGINETVAVAGQRALLAWKMREALAEASAAEKNLILAEDSAQMTRFVEDTQRALDRLAATERELQPLLNVAQMELIKEIRRNVGEWAKLHEVVVEQAAKSGNKAMRIAFEQAAESLKLVRTTLLELESTEAPSGSVPGTQAIRPDPPVNSERLKLIGALKQLVARLKRLEQPQVLALARGEIQHGNNAFEDVCREFEDGFKALELLVAETEHQTMDRLSAAFDQYSKTQAAVFRLISDRGENSAFEIASQQGLPLIKHCVSLLSTIVRQSESEMEGLRVDADRLFRASRMLFLIFGVCGILFGILAAYVTASGIARNVAVLSAYAGHVQQTGDLSTQVPKLAEDELGTLAQSFDHMRGALYRKESELSLVNRRLELANTRLEHQNQEVEQFVYIVSHDLKSPLVTCKGFIGLIREDLPRGESESVVDSLGRIDRACDQMARIIDDLLEISHIGRTSEPHVRLNMNEIIGELQERFAKWADAQNVELLVADHLPPIVADQTSIVRAFENLLINALKYGRNPNGTVISVGAVSSDEEVRFFVRDNGPGINPEYHKRIFGLFQRLDASAPGTGLGLASVTKVMQIHHGKAWVESTPGAGATFWLSFPR